MNTTLALRLPTRSTLILLLGWTLACTGETPPATSAAPPPTVAPTELPTNAAAIAALPTDMAYYQATPYTEGALQAMSLTELQLRRNTIFARAGQPFRKKWLDTAFRQQDWYRPLPVADMTLLTPVDRANAALIASVEAGFSMEELRDRKQRLTAGSYDQIPDSWDIPMDDQRAFEIALVSAALGEWEGDPATPMSERSPIADPNVLDAAITEAQLSDLSRRDLRIVRNTIFARHGRAFKSELLQDYFGQKVWYTVDPAYSDEKLTEIDRANITTIVKVEESLGGMMTDAQQAEFEMNYFGGA